MAFWSSQTLTSRLATLVDPLAIVDCNAIELKVGSEIYITPNLANASTHTKQLLIPGEPFSIPPGQFAYLLTEETVSVDLHRKLTHV